MLQGPKNLDMQFYQVIEVCFETGVKSRGIIIFKSGRCPHIIFFK